MNGKEQDFLIPFKDVSVKCCKCYVDYWKLLRINQDKKDYFMFDYSIEKAKSFRNYYCDDKHFFISVSNVLMLSCTAFHFRLFSLK